MSHGQTVSWPFCKNFLESSLIFELRFFKWSSFGTYVNPVVVVEFSI